jgi:hypothetical protein
MARRFEDDLEQARKAQQSLGTKMAAYINGPNLDNNGKGLERKPSPSNGGTKERPLISNDRAPSGGRDDRDQAAARSAMRGINISRTVNLNLPGDDSHITGSVGGKARRTKVKDWKDPGSDPAPQQGTAITKLTRLAVPIVRPIRAETVDGVTSFHFSHEAISKTKTERVSDSGRVTRPGSAKDHARYIERDGALARLDGAGALGSDTLEKIETDLEKIVIERGEEKSLADIAAELGRAAVGGVYIERQEAMAAETDGVAVLYTNIDADPIERRKFWELVEEHEKKPGEDAMRVRIASNPQLWLDVINDPDCPEDVIKTIEAADPMFEVRVRTEDNDRMRALMFRHGWEAPKRRKDDGLNQEEQAAVNFQLDKADGIVFEDARGGRIQYRIIGELPHEVDHAARVRIVRGFAQEFERRNLPYVAVMHAPDHTNSDKNWHFHLIYHDRPANRFTGKDIDHIRPLRDNASDYIRRQHEIATVSICDEAVLGQAGNWDFTVKAKYRKKNRHTMETYPFAQEKHRECSKIDFVPKLRKVLADITNEELEAAGHRRRLDPRKYTEIGIERQPDEHLGTRAAQHETSGISTDIGRQNERNQWAYQMTQIHRYQEAEELKLRGDIAQMRRVNQAIVGDDPRANLIDRHIIRYEQLRRAAIEHEVIARMIVENIDRAASRANKVRLTCEKHLTAISKRKATRRQISHRTDYQNKLSEAIDHLGGLRIIFAEEVLQVGRSEDQAKLLQLEAKESHAEYAKLVKEVQIDRGVKVPTFEVPTKASYSNNVDQKAGTGNEGVGALTKKQIDVFVETVLNENIRLVIRDRRIVPATEDQRFAGVVTAPNYASFQARLKGIHGKQVEAVDALLDVLDNRPEAVESIIGPDGKAIVTLKINDKRLQAALQTYQDDKTVSRAIDRAIALQRPPERLSGTVAPTMAIPDQTPAQPVPATKPPEPVFPYQDVVRRALYERTLSGVQWEEADNKRFLILTNASAERLRIPSRIEISADVAPIIEKTISAADREELRLRAYIESRPDNVMVTKLRIIVADYAPDELREIALKHSKDPQRRAAYEAMPQFALRSYVYSPIYLMDLAMSDEGKAAAKAANERTEIIRTPSKMRDHSRDNEPDPRFANMVPKTIRDPGRELKVGIHVKLDAYLLAEANGDDAARRLMAEEIVADREALRAARTLTQKDQARINADSIYNSNIRNNRSVKDMVNEQDISRQMDRGLTPKGG